jgi:hypothetical protein
MPVKIGAKSILAAIVLWPAGHAGGGPVAVADADCRLLERHAPAADVAYKPGVDVRGKPVVVADASPYGQVATPQQVAIDLSLPLRNFIAQPPARLGDAEVQIGQFTVDLATNQLAFNGQPLSDPELAQLVAACRTPRAR